MEGQPEVASSSPPLINRMSSQRRRKLWSLAARAAAKVSQDEVGNSHPMSCGEATQVTSHCATSCHGIGSAGDSHVRTQDSGVSVDVSSDSQSAAVTSNPEMNTSVVLVASSISFDKQLHALPEAGTSLTRPHAGDGDAVGHSEFQSSSARHGGDFNFAMSADSSELTRDHIVGSCQSNMIPTDRKMYRSTTSVPARSTRSVIPRRTGHPATLGAEPSGMRLQTGNSADTSGFGSSLDWASLELNQSFMAMPTAATTPARDCHYSVDIPSLTYMGTQCRQHQQLYQQQRDCIEGGHNPAGPSRPGFRLSEERANSMSIQGWKTTPRYSSRESSIPGSFGQSQWNDRLTGIDSNLDSALVNRKQADFHQFMSNYKQDAQQAYSRDIGGRSRSLQYDTYQGEIKLATTKRETDLRSHSGLAQPIYLFTPHNPPGQVYQHDAQPMYPEFQSVSDHVWAPPSDYSQAYHKPKLLYSVPPPTDELYDEDFLPARRNHRYSPVSLGHQRRLFAETAIPTHFYQSARSRNPKFPMPWRSVDVAYHDIQEQTDLTIPLSNRVTSCWKRNHDPFGGYLQSLRGNTQGQPFNRRKRPFQAVHSMEDATFTCTPEHVIHARLGPPRASLPSNRTTPSRPFRHLTKVGGVQATDSFALKPQGSEDLEQRQTMRRPPMRAPVAQLSFDCHPEEVDDDSLTRLRSSSRVRPLTTPACQIRGKLKRDAPSEVEERTPLQTVTSNATDTTSLLKKTKSTKAAGHETGEEPPQATDLDAATSSQGQPVVVVKSLRFQGVEASQSPSPDNPGQSRPDLKAFSDPKTAAIKHTSTVAVAHTPYHIPATNGRIVLSLDLNTTGTGGGTAIVTKQSQPARIYGSSSVSGDYDLVEYWEHSVFARARIGAVCIAGVATVCLVYSVCSNTWVYRGSGEAITYSGFWKRCNHANNACDFTVPFLTKRPGWQDGALCILFFALAISLLALGLSLFGHFASAIPKRMYYFHSGGEAHVVAAFVTVLSVLIYHVTTYVHPPPIDTTSLEPISFGAAYIIAWVAGILQLTAALMLFIDELFRKLAHHSSQSVCLRGCLHSVIRCYTVFQQKQRWRLGATTTFGTLGGKGSQSQR